MKKIALSFLSIFLPLIVRASDSEARILAEMNLARTQPQLYADIVARSARPGREGDRAIQEAVRFLQRARPLPPLTACDGLTRSAMAHVADSGAHGTRGHEGTDGSHTWDRVERYGRWVGLVGENILYGAADARQAVVILIVDDGVSGRKHRANIFHKNFRVVGIASGPHATAGSILVTDFAQQFVASDARVAKL